MFNLFKKKMVEDVVVPVVTPTELIAHANSIVDNALSAFNTAVIAIVRANALLDDATKEHSEKISELETSLAFVKAEKEQANENMKANLALKEKLLQFVK